MKLLLLVALASVTTADKATAEEERQLAAGLGTLLGALAGNQLAGTDPLTSLLAGAAGGAAGNAAGSIAGNLAGNLLVRRQGQGTSWRQRQRQEQRGVWWTLWRKGQRYLWKRWTVWKRRQGKGTFRKGRPFWKEEVERKQRKTSKTFYLNRFKQF